VSDSLPGRSAGPYGGSPSPYSSGQGTSANLADILERVLDKGIVIAGDIQINLLDIELLTIKLRLLVASVDKAKEMGIDWWEHDPSLSSRARQDGPDMSLGSSSRARSVEGGTEKQEIEQLRAEVRELRDAAGLTEDRRKPITSAGEPEVQEAEKPRSSRSHPQPDDDPEKSRAETSRPRRGDTARGEKQPRRARGRASEDES
jgi:hypothetical protein